jgi:hypothetical protein
MSDTFVTNQINEAPLSEIDATYETQAMNKIDKPFLLAAFLSLVASVSLWFLVDKLSGIFVGIWVPSILALWCGIRNRVKDTN